MQKIILDTNVIVSALISSGIPSKIISELVLKDRVDIQISDEIFLEYLAVLRRPKFSRVPDFQINAEIVLSRIEDFATRINPEVKLDLIKDKSDNIFLELALETRADYLITGNTKDFTIDHIGDTKIVTPTEYWHECKP